MMRLKTSKASVLDVSCVGGAGLVYMFVDFPQYASFPIYVGCLSPVVVKP